MKVDQVAVLGANGTMGCNVAAIFASFGQANVYLVCRRLEDALFAVNRAASSVRADSIKKKLIPCTFQNLNDVLPSVDLIFESVSEDLTIKKNVIAAVRDFISPEAIICSGSSGLSITELAECYPDEMRKHFFGVHFFNPPYTMKLCELTATKYSDAVISDSLEKYLRDKLFRAVIRTSDSPAFLGNRIGFMFINEALRYAEKYKDYGGIDFIDTVVGPFSGRAMPPLRTADFVGLDVHKAIVDNLFSNTHDFAHNSFILPEYSELLVKAGKFGRKVHCGLYRTEILQENIKKYTVYDLNSASYRDIKPYRFPFADNMNKFISEGDYEKAAEVLISNHSVEAEICLKLILKFILYSIYAGMLVSGDVHSADVAMAEGFNWCPPLAWADLLGKVVDLRSLMTVCEDEIPSIVIDELYSEIEPSLYHYEPFFRAAR